MHCSRLFRYFFIACFLVFLWTPLVLALVNPYPEMSLLEKRKRASFPVFDFKHAADFTDRFEDYFNDYFGLRDSLLFWFNSLQYHLLNATTSKKVIVGRDGWLFQNGKTHVDDMRNTWPFSEGELRHWGKILSAKYRWCKQRGIEYVFVITPSKHLLNKEKLPSAYRPVDRRSRADQLVDYLNNETDVPVVYMQKELKKAGRRLRTYHKTDTHWNSYGAYTGYRAVMKHLESRLDEVHSISLKSSDFKMDEQPGGDLARSLNLPDTIREDAPRVMTRELDCINNTSPPGIDNDTSRNREWFTTTCAQKKYYTILFHDSYATAMMPYLSESFLSVYYIPHSPVRMENFQKIIQKQGPDIVIEQRTSRWLRTPEG